MTVNELLRFALLAPDIAQAALGGTLPRTCSLELLQRLAMPPAWQDQIKTIATSSRVLRIAASWPSAG